MRSGTLKVTRSLQPDGSFAEPKTVRGRRTVVVTPATVAALKSWRVRQAAERLAAGPSWHDGDLVFADEVGRPMPHDRALKTLRRRCRQLSLPTIGPYHLRHTSATLALESGVPLKAISERLGHTTITLTADVYAHATPRMDAEAAQKLAVALGE